MRASNSRVGRPAFWLLIVGLTGVLTLEPGLFLVGAAFALSGLTLVWILLLARMLLAEWWVRLRAARDAAGRADAP